MLNKINSFIESLLEYENPSRDTAEAVIVMLCIGYFIVQFVRAGL